MFGVTTGNLNKAVKRNIKRFPEDFMFQLTKDEEESLRFQFGSFKRGQHTKLMAPPPEEKRRIAGFQPRKN